MLCKSFVIILMMLELFDCAKNESEPRFVPPPPPFAPPLLYPVNAATGILVAIAIPVPLPSQSVFVSYNFEANYNMPNAAPDSFPGKIDRWTVQNPTPFPIIYGPPAVPGEGGTVDDAVARNLEEVSVKNETEIITLEKQNEIKRSLNEREILTRSGFYHLLESRLNAHGMNGKKCLLLAICESAQIPFLDENGVIGHVLHIILTPSSSMDEKLPLEYAKAEGLGKTGKCIKYQKQCNFSILSLFSKII